MPFSSCSRGGTCCRYGFTLIELLVVISILALLISILVPSLSEAKWHAKTAMCANNLHITGIAVLRYMSHYVMDDPFIFYGGTGDGTRESSYTYGAPANAPGNPAEAMLKPGYPNFLDDAQPFFCPCAEEKYETHYNIYAAAGGFGMIWGTYGWLYPHVAQRDDPFDPDDHRNGRDWVGANSHDLLMRDFRPGPYEHTNGLFLNGHASMIGRDYNDVADFLFGRGRDWYHP